MADSAPGAGRFFDRHGSWLKRDHASRKAETERPGGILWHETQNWGVEGNNLSECIKIHAGHKGNTEGKSYENWMLW